MKKILVVVLVVAIALLGATAAMAAKHGTNCITCHAPHDTGTEATLWRSGAEYGCTVVITGGDTRSDLCQSCHAGISRGPGATGASTSNNHPLKTAGANNAGVPVNTVAQCHTCHDVHNSANNYYNTTCVACHSTTVNW